MADYTPKHRVIAQSCDILGIIFDLKVTSLRLQMNNKYNVNTSSLFRPMRVQDCPRRTRLMTFIKVTGGTASRSGKKVVSTKKLSLRCVNHSRTCGVDIYKISIAPLTKLRLHRLLSGSYTQPHIA